MLVNSLGQYCMNYQLRRSGALLFNAILGAVEKCLWHELKVVSSLNVNLQDSLPSCDLRPDHLCGEGLPRVVERG